jgi:hypothetical protein
VTALRRRRIPTTLDVVAQLMLVGALVVLAVAVLVDSPALIRLAGLFVVVALAGVVVAYAWRGWLLLRGAWNGENAIVQEVYDAIDDHIGAGRAERRKWARWHRNLDFWTLRWKRLLRPPAFRPGDIQMTGKRHYIFDLAYNRPRRALRRWRRWEVAAFTIRYSLEVNIYIGQWFHLLEQKVCMALGLEWKQGVLDLAHDHATRTVRITRRQPVAVTGPVDLRQEANDAG